MVTSKAKRPRIKERRNQLSQIRNINESINQSVLPDKFKAYIFFVKLIPKLKIKIIVINTIPITKNAIIAAAIIQENNLERITNNNRLINKNKFFKNRVTKFNADGGKPVSTPTKKKLRG